jgi:uncharacterized repeat protein (TIGR03803 family)
MKNPLSLPAISYCKVLLFVLITFATVFGSSAQNLWGVLATGGSDNLGTLGHYNLSTSSWVVDYNFAIENKVSGYNPTTELTEANGKFYGLAAGGTNNLGELFEWDPHTNIYTTKVNFSLALGSTPLGALTYANGKLYGMTSNGGVKKGGILFSWDPATELFQKLMDLEAHPKGSLTEVNGKLYGVSNTIFEWDIASNVYTRKADISCDNGCDLRGRLAYVNGKFYGATLSGGVNGVGAIFEWDPAANVITKKIDMSVAMGSSTYGSLTSKDGKLYGLTFKGGTHNGGVIFEWDPATNIYIDKINLGAGHLGRNPKGSMIVVDDKFYGLTSGAGGNGGGTLFEWNASTNIYLDKVNFGGGLVASNGQSPRGALAFSDGKFYGMTYWGGISNEGVLFEWNPSINSYIKKINFAANTDSGKNPTGSLIYNNGKLFGIAQGGANRAGGVFKWDLSTHHYSMNVNFEGNFYGDELLPQGSLSKGVDKLYGTTKDVENFFDQIFECDLEADAFTKDMDFYCSFDMGCSPSPLTFVNGKFYGATFNGGTADLGTLYEWDPATKQYTKKVDFNGIDGSKPNGSLTYQDGVLYGMTTAGGTSDVGVIFSWDPINNIYSKRIDLSIANGSSPLGSLTYHDDKFYGMTYTGGANDAGVIFEWNPVTNVYERKIDLISVNGSAPKGSLTYSGNKFYGVTSSGGVNGIGVLFEWNPVTNAYAKKVDFSTATGGSPGYIQLVEANVSLISQSITFSALPEKTFGVASFQLTATASSGLPVIYKSSDVAVATINGNTVTVVGAGVTIITASQAGNENYLAAPDVSQTLTVNEAFTTPVLYGLTSTDGQSQIGSVVKSNLDGSELKSIYKFTAATSRRPIGSLLLGTDGLLYGMSRSAGNDSGRGTIFKIKIDGSGYTELHNLDAYPSGSSLIQTTDGTLFGMTSPFENGLQGRLFKINMDGSSYQDLRTLGSGGEPGFLMQASNGSIYGTDASIGFGNIFRMNADGSGYTILHTFNGSDGSFAYGALMEATDGSLYGVASQGGPANIGTIYKINTNGTGFTVLHNFYLLQEGVTPSESLVQAPDGSPYLYGMTLTGGQYNSGLIYKINMTGDGYTVLHSFTGSDGARPACKLIHIDNKLYGYTTNGGLNGGGVIFNYDLQTSSYHKLTDFSDATGMNPVFGGLLLMRLPTIDKPTIAASNISFSNVLSTSMTVSFTPGNGSRHLVVMKTGAAPTLKPVDGTSYSDLEDLGHGEKIVSTGPENIVNVAELLPYRRYYFTVFEYNADSLGNTKYLLTNAPTASQQTRLLPNVYLIKPGDGAVNQMVQITLKANLVEGASTYTFEVSTNENFLSSKSLTSNNVSQLIDSLQYNTLYYAHVKTNLRADYGKVTTFTTRTAESLAYVTSPANNAVNVPTKTAVASNSVPYANEYTIQLSETNNFSVIAFETTGPSRILHFTGLKGNTTYYSRVLVDLSPVFGPVRNFTTQVTTSSARTNTGENDLKGFVVTVYPNPFHERLSLYIQSARYDEGKITLADLSGRTVYESTVRTNSNITIDKPLSNGVYFLRVNVGGFNKLIRVVSVD